MLPFARTLRWGRPDPEGEAGALVGSRVRSGRMAVAGVTLMAVAAISAFLAVAATNHIVDLNARATAVRESAGEIAGLLADLQAREAAFLLTREPRLATDFQSLAGRVPDRIDALSRLLRMDDQRQRLEQMKSAVESGLARSRSVMAMASSGDLADANAAFAAQIGEGAHDRARTVIGDLITRNAEILSESREAYRAATRREIAALVAAALSITLFGLWQVRESFRMVRALDDSRHRLSTVNLTLEAQVESRTAELSHVNQLLEASLAASRVSASSQDRNLAFTWVSDPNGVFPGNEALGRKDADVLPPGAMLDAVVAAKRRVLTGGGSERLEITLDAPEGRVWYVLHLAPLMDGEVVVGVISAAVEVTEDRRARRRLRQLSKELAATVARFDVALRGADVFVFAQDVDRRITFASADAGGLTRADMLGRRDEDLVPGPLNEQIVPLKNDVLRTGEPQQVTLPSTGPDGQTRWLKIRIEASREADGGITGLIGCAVDITTERNAQERERRLADELRTTVQRFQIALRGAEVTVFTQDEQLAYTWVSQDFLRRNPHEFLGRTDEDILPAETAGKLVAFKRSVIEEGDARQGEFRFADGVEERWYFVRAEPRRDDAGRVVGLIAAAVDVTERRQRETHIRILLRELTHRTKNLLAVVQAMSRQTLVASSSARDFEARFSGRLQGLASSLDLLVSENWEGASVEELVRSQLGHYRDDVGRRIVLSGPDVRLEPEAAQNIGLALHELGTNSSKYGALSSPSGRVEVTWRFVESARGEALRFSWVERGGPPASPPARKGFGYAVLERLVPRAVGGRAEILHEPEGLTWSVDIAPDLVQAPEAGIRFDHAAEA